MFQLRVSVKWIIYKILMHPNGPVTIMSLCKRRLIDIAQRTCTVNSGIEGSTLWNACPVSHHSMCIIRWVSRDHSSDGYNKKDETPSSRSKQSLRRQLAAKLLRLGPITVRGAWMSESAR